MVFQSNDFRFDFESLDIPEDCYICLVLRILTPCEHDYETVDGCLISDQPAVRKSHLVGVRMIASSTLALGVCVVIWRPKMQLLATICWASRLSWKSLDAFEDGEVERLDVEVNENSSSPSGSWYSRTFMYRCICSIATGSTCRLKGGTIMALIDSSKSDPTALAIPNFIVRTACSETLCSLAGCIVLCRKVISPTELVRAHQSIVTLDWETIFFHTWINFCWYKTDYSLVLILRDTAQANAAIP